jgi:hypothetical protein
MVVLATVMAGFMLLLVLLTYSSAQRVRKALVLQVERETEKRAMALEYFFSERRENLVEISRSRELNVYFENQALGMSMEYGLRQSLPPIREKLEYYLDSKRIGVESIFSRFVLVESDGTLLVDTSRPEDAPTTDSTFRSYLAPELRQGKVLVMSRTNPGPGKLQHTPDGDGGDSPGGPSRQGACRTGRPCVDGLPERMRAASCRRAARSPGGERKPGRHPRLRTVRGNGSTGRVGPMGRSLPGTCRVRPQRRAPPSRAL